MQFFLSFPYFYVFNNTNIYCYGLVDDVIFNNNNGWINNNSTEQYICFIQEKERKTKNYFNRSKRRQFSKTLLQVRVIVLLSTT